MENCSDTQSSQLINRPLAVAYAGLDVRKDSITVSVAIRDPLRNMLIVEDFGSFANRPTQIYRLVETVGGQFAVELQAQEAQTMNFPEPERTVFEPQQSRHAI